MIGQQKLSAAEVTVKVFFTPEKGLQIQGKNKTSPIWKRLYLTDKLEVTNVVRHLDDDS